MNAINQTPLSEIKLGILGGGQLGKMLIASASKWGMNTFVLDPSEECPAAAVCNTFIKGDFKNYDDVYSFGKLVDILTIEIENVNTDALIQLAKEGKQIYPEPGKLEIIKDKGLQKKFYAKHAFPSPAYTLYSDRTSIISAIENGIQKFPFVQKLCRAGYDGKGVSVIRGNDDLIHLLDGESIVEKLIDFQKEISVIVAKSTLGEIRTYQPVEMVFNPIANLVEYLICPAPIAPEIATEACELAKSVISAFDITGILAVEMFLDKNNKLYINEVAPRPHNSGHQTIEAAYTSQYEQQLRAILGLPLGSTKLISPSIMLNLLGGQGFSGVPVYEGLQECLKIEGANIYLYGKNETRPFRKMGHVTIIDNDIKNLENKAKIIQQTLIIKA
ncbi:MAG: 5-(carboxyamino)imidazole ribonucleotide synthase [Bacteroidota bacterium]|nr:5-(carboxyamino)imidazole ribonucleotide synthase [Bacteroidota bacterium]